MLWRNQTRLVGAEMHVVVCAGIYQEIVPSLQKELETAVEEVTSFQVSSCKLSSTMHTHAASLQLASV